METPIETRYVFLLLLAIADQSGHVHGTNVALARRFNISLDHFNRAIDLLSSPDPDSNTPDMDGRRIVPTEVGNGYRIVNYLKYRGIRNAEQRREYQREYQRDYRKKRAEQAPTVNTCLRVNHSKPQLTQAEAEAEAEAVQKKVPKKRAHFVAPNVSEVSEYASEIGLPDSETEHFYDFYQSNGWKVGKNPMKDWKATMRNWKRRNTKGGATQSRSAPSIWELKQAIEAKQAQAKQIYDRYASEGPLGVDWSSPEHRNNYVALRKEIRTLTERIGNAA